jgi:membrane associated rhomboid family serine protease
LKEAKAAFAVAADENTQERVMANPSKTLKAIGYAAGTSLAASLGVLLLGAVLFGFPFSGWAEWEGGLVGVSGTLAGVVGAALGLRWALRDPRQKVR